MNELLTFLQIDENFPDMVVRLLFAAVLVGLIGYERENKNQNAGLRTHLLVGVGSCCLMLFNIYGLGGTEGTDMARIPSYIISGIGFLGAGVIITREKELNVIGLTTAASIWVVAAIGIICGAGMFGLGIVATILVLFCLFVLKKLERG